MRIYENPQATSHNRCAPRSAYIPAGVSEYHLLNGEWNFAYFTRDIDVIIRETEGGLDVDIRTSGVEGAPWRVELAFNGIDRISNEHMTMPINGDEVLVLKDSFFEVSNYDASMEVGPAFGLHHFTDGKEDSEVKTPGAATVYMTDYTEFHHVISIRP